MNEQIEMFEPVGDELAALALRHWSKASSLLVRSTNLAGRGFASSSAVFTRLSNEAFSHALVCESACQFERLAGL